MKTISNTNIFSLLLLCLAAAILLVLLLPLFFYKKIEDDIIITCNVNNNNKTIKRGLDFFVVENILDDPSRENIVSKFYKKHVIIKT
jgi:hypothetical protein